MGKIYYSAVATKLEVPTNFTEDSGANAVFVASVLVSITFERA